MKNFLMKKLNKKGFTLAELLIVVAIIGVLVAVSIPIFSTQLEKSREHTDEANLRAAKAAAVALFLDNNETAGLYIYDAEQGCLVAKSDDATKMQDCPVPTATTVKGYGKGGKKVGDKDLKFRMSTDPVYAEDLATGRKKGTGHGMSIDASATGAAVGVTLNLPAVNTFDGIYAGNDEVRDDIIWVGISSNDGTLAIGATGGDKAAADFIYLAWGPALTVTSSN